MQGILRKSIKKIDAIRFISDDIIGSDLSK